MDPEDGRPQVWAEMSDEELRDRLQSYLWLAANTPNSSRRQDGSTQARSRAPRQAGAGGRSQKLVTTHSFTPHVSC
jgi:hypothetical protein